MRRIILFLCLFLVILITGCDEIRKDPEKLRENLLNLTIEDYKTYLNYYIDKDEFYSDSALINNHFYPEFNVPANEYETIVTGKYDYRILEITANETSDLNQYVSQIKTIYQDQLDKKNLGNKNFINNFTKFTVDTIRIKEFVASRTDFLNTYDAIYISDAVYNPETKCKGNCKGDTRSILNDITESKAGIIVSNYVNSGLPVFIHSNALANNNTNFYKVFNPLIDEDNVFILNYNNETLQGEKFLNTLATMAVTQLTSLKPKFKVTNYPKGETYTNNSNLNFTINLLNKNNADLYMYLDFNLDEQFTDDELVKIVPLTRGNNQFSLKVSSLMTREFKYKLLVDGGNQKSAFLNSFKITTTKQTIKVLNIVGKDYSYTNPNPFTQLALYDITDYQFDYKVCTINDLAKTDGNCSYNNVFSDYEVILVNPEVFTHNINYSLLTNKIKTEMENGKLFIYTSGFSTKNHNWVDMIDTYFGLTDTKTVAYPKNYVIDNLKTVNNNGFISYPYDLKNYDYLNELSQEKYQLDLNNQDVIPLMNMNLNTSNFDNLDSYNSYFSYKYKNIVYVNLTYTVYNFLNLIYYHNPFELQSLANAIINLYISKNSPNDYPAPDIVTIKPNNSYENTIIDVKDSLDFSFTVDSQGNRDYTYKVFVDDVMVISDEVNKEGNSVNLSDIAAPTINTMVKKNIKVKVYDTNNIESAVYEFNIFVANYDNYNISLSKEIFNAVTYDGNKYIEVNKRNYYSIKYKLTYNNIDVTGLDGLPTTITFKELVLTQAIPQNMTVENNISLGEVTYQLEGNYYVPIQKTRTFTMPFYVNTMGSYELESANMTLTGFGSDHMTVNDQPLNFTAIKPIDNSMVTPVFTDYIYIPFESQTSVDLTEKFNISDKTIINSILFNMLGTQDKFTIENNIISANKIGEELFEIVVEDIFGNTVRPAYKVISYVPIDEIDLEDLEMVQDQEAVIAFIIDAENIQFELKSQTQGIVSVNRNGNEIIIKALKPGNATYRFYGYDEFGNIVEDTISIVVRDRNGIIFRYPSISLYINDLFTLDDLKDLIIIFNEEYDLNNVEFISETQDIININEDTGIIDLLDTGIGTIKATLPNGDEAYLSVNIYDMLSDGSGFRSDYKAGFVKVYVGYKQYLENYIEIVPQSIPKKNLKMIFVITDNNNIVEFDPLTNTYMPINPGTITIAVTIEQYNDEGILIDTKSDTIVNFKILEVDEDDDEHNSH